MSAQRWVKLVREAYVVERHFLVVSHTGRAETLDASIAVCRKLIANGVTPVLCATDLDDVLEKAPDLVVQTLGDGVPLVDLELAIVLGGDGTILRAAELVRESATPLLGINLGHVGFLAEAERETLDESVHLALNREYEIDERMTLSVRVKVDTKVVYTT